MRDKDTLKISFIKRRMLIIRGVEFGCIGVLLLKLFKMQILDNLKYSSLSNKNSRRLDYIIPKRGRILDRNDVEIAGNKIDYKIVYFKQRKNKDYMREIYKVYKILGKDLDREKPFLTKLNKNISKGHIGMFVIARNLNKKELLKLRFNLVYLKNIELKKYYVRHYKFGVSTPCIIGYVLHSQDKGDKLLKLNNDYKIGISGIERIEDIAIGGSIGSRYNLVNAIGQKVDEKIIMKEKDGNDVKITIDQRLQNYLSEQMYGKNGSAIVLDVSNGDILAMVSMPTMDPNITARGVNDDEWSEFIKSNENSTGLFLNKNLASIYPPGSTFKIVSSILGLNNGVINTQQKFECTGTYKIGKMVKHCWKHKDGGHGWVDFDTAIAQSCNCYFYHLSTMLDIDDIYDTAYQLGFNQKLMPDFPEELQGSIPNKSWKRKTYHQRWYAGDNANCIIGQGYVSVTPIQLATMIARVASGKKIIPNYKFSNYNKKISNLGFDENALQIVRKGLFSVLNEPYGIARGMAKKKYGICGKTGTAQVVSERLNAKDMLSGKIEMKKHDHALFVGFAPYDNPRYAVCVVVEHGIGGARMATPIGVSALSKAIDLE